MRTKKIIAFFLLIAVLLMPVAVLADSSLPEPPVGAWEYWAIVKDYKDYYKLVASHEPFVKERYGLKLYAFDGLQVYALTSGNDVWNLQNEYYGSTYYSINSMHRSNHDVVNDDGSGAFFF
jgi:hypothetical protein